MTVAKPENNNGMPTVVSDACSSESLEYQKEFLGKAQKKPLAKGDKWYLVDNKWYKQWKKYVGFDEWETTSVGEQSAHPGKMDNYGLLTDRGDPEVLREHLMDEVDYVLVPEEGWTKFIEWYGLAPQQKPIVRTVVDYGMFLKNLRVEIYKMELKLCLHPNIQEFKTFRFSKVTTLQEVEQMTRTLFEVPESATTRLWNRFSTNTLELLTDKSRTIQDESLYSTQTIVLEVQNKNGSWPRETTEPRTAEQPSYAAAVANDSNALVPCASSNSNTNSNGSSRQGQCGLANLGNTCFMNSALQCMSNTPSLTEYFLSDKYLEDINRDNPLGMHGEIADAYSNLIKNLWSGSCQTFAPRTFKQKVGRFAPQFHGYMQQDCQELMSFLLDGLHEDLNRVKTKPYIEAKNSEGRPDQVLATEAWNNYLKRNDSIVVDTFHGLLKSTLVCPECQHVSVTFDPFCYLSLPLPNRKEKVLNFIWYPLKKKKLFRIRTHIPVYPVKCSKKELYNIIAKASQVQGSPTIADNIVVAVLNPFDKTVERIIEPKDEELEDFPENVHVYQLPRSPWKSMGSLIRVYTREMPDDDNADDESKFSQAKQFGVPFFLHAQKKSITSDRLYKDALEWLEGRFVNPKNQQDDQHGSDDDSQMDVDEQENEEINESAAKKSLKRRLFEIHLVNEMANTEMQSIDEEETTIALKDRSFVTIDWYPDAKKSYFEESKCTSYTTKDGGTRGNTDLAKRPIQLSECLDLFTTMEQLGIDDLWYCPMCKKHQQATKRFDIWSLPPVLIIHLKRFSYNRYFRDKIDTLVDFPINDLSLDKFVLDPDHKPLPYDLIGVANHYGGMGGGHYTAYAKNKLTKQWNHFDDWHVTPIPEATVVSKAAYVLFYQRRDIPRANGMETEDQKILNSSGTQVNPRMTTRSQVNNSNSDEPMNESYPQLDI